MRQLFIMLCMLLLAAPACAASSTKPETATQPGGFEGPVSGADAETAAAALQLPADAKVLLKGNLVSRVAGEKNVFVFRDATGQLEVHITPKQFRGVTINPDMPVQLTGKIVKTENPNDKIRVRITDLQVMK